MTFKQVAEYIQIEKYTVYELACIEIIPSLKL